MNDAYTYIADLAKAIEPPLDGTLSRTLFSDERVKVVLFGFSAGQELSEHTSTKPAIVQVLSGKALLTLGGDKVAAGPGSWIRMPAGLPHAVKAETPVIMLLTLLKA